MHSATGLPAASCTASSGYGSAGSETINARPSSPWRIGTTCCCFRKRAEMSSSVGGRSGASRVDTSGAPSNSDQASARSRSETRPSRAISAVSVPSGASSCSRRARARSPSFSAPRATSRLHTASSRSIISDGTAAPDAVITDAITHPTSTASTHPRFLSTPPRRSGPALLTHPIVAGARAGAPRFTKRGQRPAAPAPSRTILRQDLPADAHAHAGAALVAADRATEGDIGVAADLARVTHRQRRATAVAAHTHAQPVGLVDALGAEGHLRHRRPHRAHLVQPLVDSAEPIVDLVAEAVEVRLAHAAVEELLIGLGLGRAERLHFTRV